MRKLTREEFILKARCVHGWKYDYSEVVYVNGKTKVVVICPKHGRFLVTPNNHLRGNGCSKCRYEKLSILQADSKEAFVRKAREVHGEWYDYSKVEYVNSRIPILITCPKHGDFKQTPDNHLGGHGCRKCGYDVVSKARKDTLEIFIQKAKNKHGGKYDYSEVEYKNCHEPVKIICPVHGEFISTPYTHVYGIGCTKCSGKYHKNTEDFIKEASHIHNNKYDYSKVDYVRGHDNVIIICPQHGEFEQTPSSHLQGQGCPACKESLGERFISEWLDSKNIKYKREYHIYPSQLSLIGRNRFRVDFYLTERNTIIEFHGEQHYSKNKFFHKDDDAFQDQLDRDKRLREHCKQNGIKLIEIPYTKIDKIPQILSKKIGRR